MVTHDIKILKKWHKGACIQRHTDTAEIKIVIRMVAA